MINTVSITAMRDELTKIARAKWRKVFEEGGELAKRMRRAGIEQSFANRAATGSRSLSAPRADFPRSSGAVARIQSGRAPWGEQHRLFGHDAPARLRVLKKRQRDKAWDTLRKKRQADFEAEYGQS